MAKPGKVSDADLSSAGDDFHILWAIKKSLGLLNFDAAGLKAVQIEGFDPVISNKIDPMGNMLLGIDLLEFYGGEYFEEANRISISQLKYSTLRVDKNWTFFKLYDGKGSHVHKGSIIHRLASIFKALIEEFGRDSVLSKVEIKFVSNRNFNSQQLEQLLSVQQKLLSNKSKKIPFATLFKSLPKYQKAFEKLFKASELKSSEFTDFLKLMDFSDCGVDSRDALEKELIKSIGKTSITSRHQFNSFSRLIWSKMMPESKGTNKISVIDIIANLGFNNGSLENLFPVSQSSVKLENNVKREQLPSIIKEIEESRGDPICINAGAGMGKSTIVQQLASNIPAYCECITFDCFGNGSYLDPSDRRHLHRYALVQISNEIAKRFGTDFLITNSISDETYIKELKRRINDAIAILRQRSAHAYLVIIIDAADNNITAAAKRGEVSFIHDLVDEPFTEGCKLVFTCRTHRKDSLQLPRGYKDIYLEPFTIQETKKYLSFYFPKSSKHEVTEFHKLTRGIPRVQSYAINLRQDGIFQVINYLRPAGKSVEDIIEERITEAVKKIGHQGFQLISQFFIYLITLPRPVPSEYLSHLLNETEELITDIASDLWHGLILENNLLSFRDEDIENYIRSEYIPENYNLQKIADLFLNRVETDEYASINLGNILFEADRKEELKEIVLFEKYRSIPLDPVRNRAVYIDRTKLAMKIAHKETDNLTFFKLLFIAAEQSKTDKALTNLLVNNPDLVIQYGDDSSLAKLSANSQDKTWGGSYHLTLAGIYSRFSSKKEIAKEHLRVGRQWLNWRSTSIGKDELHQYPISPVDIALETEAVMRLSDCDRAYKSLSRWTPKPVRLSSGNIFLDNILYSAGDDEIKQWLNKLDFPFSVQFILVNKLFMYGHSMIGFDHNEIFNYLKKILRNKISFGNEFYLSIVKYCEIILFEELGFQKDILVILRLINFQIPSRVPYFSSNYTQDKQAITEMELGLRIETLKSALEGNDKPLEELYPAHLKNLAENKDRTKRDSLKRDRDEFDRFFRHMLAIYQIYADRVSCRFNSKKCDKNFILMCENISKDWEFRHYSHWSVDQLNYLAQSAMNYILLANKKKDLISLVGKSFIDGNKNEIRLKLIIVGKIAHIPSLHIIGIQLLNEADELIERSDISASEVTELFLECSRIAIIIDIAIGEYYFKKAIKSVSEIDYEAFYQIRCLYGLTKRENPEKYPKLAQDFADYIEYADLKLNYYDKKHFPYAEGIQGIFNLDKSSAFSILSQWHHRNIVDFEKYIIPILNVALNTEFINEKVACSLLPLNSYNYYDKVLEIYKISIAKFTKSGNSSSLNYLLETTFRDLELKGDLTMIEVIFKDIQSNSLVDDKLLQTIREYISFNCKLKPKCENSTSEPGAPRIYELSIDPKKIDGMSSQDIEQAIRELTKDKGDYHTSGKIQQFLSELKKECSPKNFIGHLEALVNVSPDVLGSYNLENAVEERFLLWNIHPAVRNWKKDRFASIIKRWFNEFNEDQYLTFDRINSFAKLFDINNKELAYVLKGVLPVKIENLTDESIYSSVLELQSILNPHDNYKLIEWALKRWKKNIKEDAADHDLNMTRFMSKTSDVVVAGTLRFVLGHPDKRLRWRAVHAIRRLVEHGEINILKHLLEVQNEKNCHPFQDQGSIFYWISAKLYLWIAIDRISLDNPEALSTFKDSFKKELFNENLPHALINYFIKKTYTQLYAFDNSIFTSSEWKRIQNSLTSSLPKITENQARAMKGSKVKLSNQKRHFSFDHMDTVPYWYDRLGRFFNISGNEVADIADKVIFEDWGYHGNPDEDDYIGQQIGSRDYHLLSKGHGNIPIVEDLQTYFEYHAMFCAASKLLDIAHLVKSDWIWDDWKTWLPEKSNVWSDYWISDTRDTRPLEEKYWKIEYDKFDEQWRDVVPEEKFDQEIGLGHFFGKNQVTVFAGSTRYFGENKESVSIRSALVSLKGSEALLRALQSARDNHDYRIPLEDEQDRFQIDELGLELKGWLNNPRSDNRGLDSDDPFAKKILKGHIVFGQVVEDIFPITYAPYFKKAYLDGKTISEYRHWDETTEDRYNNQLESDGSIFRIDVDFLLDFLKKAVRCLIVECSIDRQLKERIYGRDRLGKQIEDRVRIYLIKPNGYIKTLGRRDFKIRGKAH